MLDVENLSPFPHLAFTTLDVDDQPWETVVARGTYRLAPATNGSTTHAIFEASTQLPSLVADEYFGEVAQSSVRAESDLSPFKPMCDVVLVASAHSPDGKPKRSIDVAVRIVRRPIDFGAATGRVMEHRLVVHGERFFQRRDAMDRATAAIVGVMSLGAMRPSAWRLSEPEPFVECALSFENAYGGRLEVRAGETSIIDRLDADHRQTVVSAGPAADDTVVLREEYEDNPFGKGFIAPWFATAAQIDEWPAPRIETKDGPLTSERFGAMVRGDPIAPDQSPLYPEGFGVVAKHWPRRRKLAGTCDETWQRERCPRLPKDFDMSFWNGAPPSMQCPRLFGAETVELVNLLPHDAGPLDRDDAGNSVASFTLPRVGMMLRVDGPQSPIYESVFIDTLHVDLHAMEVSLVWRLQVPHVERRIPARLIALGPILDEHPELIPSVVEAAARGQVNPAEETV